MTRCSGARWLQLRMGLPLRSWWKAKCSPGAHGLFPLNDFSAPGSLVVWDSFFSISLLFLLKQRAGRKDPGSKNTVAPKLPWVYAVSLSLDDQTHAISKVEYLLSRLLCPVHCTSDAW